MDLSKILAAVFAALSAWAVFMAMRLKSAENKLAKAEEKDKDAEIGDKVHHMSDAELDSVLRKDFGPNGTRS